MPVKKSPTAVDRRFGGKVSEMTDMDSGEPPASAAPTKTRAITSWVALVAAAQIAVAKLQMAKSPARR